jgi:hypothetical protein
MVFSNNVNQMIRGRMRCPRDFTVVVGAQTSSTGTLYFAGGAGTAANYWGCGYNALRVQAFHPTASSGFTTTGQPALDVPFVAAFTWSSRNQTAYVNTAGNSVVSATATGANVPWADWPVVQIGGMRTTYLTDTTVAFVHFFGAPLHLEDDAGLQALLTDELARF